MNHLALFDLDNTLVDRQAAFTRWAQGFVEDRGLEEGALEFLCEADADGFATRHDVFVSVRSRFGLTESTESLIAAYRSTYPACFRPDPEVSSSLSQLRNCGWRIGIVTNGPPTQRDKMKRTGLIDLVDGFCISEEVGSAKPERRIFDEAIRRCMGDSSTPTSAWMVGDSAEPDIVGGRGAGLRTIWMHRNRTWGLSHAQPDLTAASIAEAVSLLLLP